MYRDERHRPGSEGHEVRIERGRNPCSNEPSDRAKGLDQRGENPSAIEEALAMEHHRRHRHGELYVVQAR
jgi:hypothetical protein